MLTAIMLGFAIGYIVATVVMLILACWTAGKAYQLGWKECYHSACLKTAREELKKQQS